MLKHGPIHARTSESSGRPWIVDKGQVNPRKYLKGGIAAHRLWHPRWSLSQIFLSRLFKNCHQWLLPRVVSFMHILDTAFISIVPPSGQRDDRPLTPWSSGHSSGTQSYTSATFSSFNMKNLENWIPNFCYISNSYPWTQWVLINNPSPCLFQGCLLIKGNTTHPFPYENMHSNTDTNWAQSQWLTLSNLGQQYLTQCWDQEKFLAESWNLKRGGISRPQFENSLSAQISKTHYLRGGHGEGHGSTNFCF